MTHPKPDAPTRQRLGWLREQIAGYASELAALEAVGDVPAFSGRHELFAAAEGFAATAGYPTSDGDLAAFLAWREAEDRFARFSDKLRRAIWLLGRTQAPGAEIIARAEDVADQFYGWFPSAALIDAASRIAHGAVRRPHGAR